MTKIQKEFSVILTNLAEYTGVTKFNPTLVDYDWFPWVPEKLDQLKRRSCPLRMSGPCQFVASVENISLMQCISRLKIVKPRFDQRVCQVNRRRPSSFSQQPLHNLRSICFFKLRCREGEAAHWFCNQWLPKRKKRKKRQKICFQRCILPPGNIFIPPMSDSEQSVRSVLPQVGAFMAGCGQRLSFTASGGSSSLSAPTMWQS